MYTDSIKWHNRVSTVVETFQTFPGDKLGN